jgi:uncharacterized protein (DUF305 family)
MKQYRLGRTVGAVGLALTLTACSDLTSSPAAPSRLDTRAAASSGGGDTRAEAVGIMSGPASDPATANFEVTFMTGMIDHHEMAIEMAEICAVKAVDEQLRTLCQSILTTQSREIDMMQSWLEQWHAVTYQPMMKPGGQRMLERLTSLGGAAFEIEFIEMMIEHDEQAVTEARRCLDSADHTDLRILCENIIATQSAEIAMMERWL